MLTIYLPHFMSSKFYCTRLMVREVRLKQIVEHIHCDEPVNLRPQQTVIAVALTFSSITFNIIYIHVYFSRCVYTYLLITCSGTVHYKFLCTCVDCLVVV